MCIRDSITPTSWQMGQSMSAESQSNNSQQGRPLRPLERELVERMLAGKDLEPGIEAKLSSALVEDMQDGGMGSIRFLTPEHAARHFGKAIAQAEYLSLIHI